MSDIDSLGIGKYLSSSSFERLTVRQNFDKLWEDVLQEAASHRHYIAAFFDHESDDAKNALKILLDRTYRAKDNINSFIHLTYIVMKGYITWIGNEVELEDLFEDLEVLEFPREKLEELENLYYKKIEKIQKRKKEELVEMEQQELEKISINNLLATKRTEWLDKISIAETEDVICDLKNFSIENGLDSLIEEIINQSQRWHRLKKKIRDGIIDSDAEQLECNKINKALIEIIKEIERSV